MSGFFGLSRERTATPRNKPSTNQVLDYTQMAEHLRLPAMMANTFNSLLKQYGVQLNADNPTLYQRALRYVVELPQQSNGSLLRQYLQQQAPENCTVEVSWLERRPQEVQIDVSF
jgi:hypothetical protein